MTSTEPENAQRTRTHQHLRAGLISFGVQKRRVDDRAKASSRRSPFSDTLSPDDFAMVRSLCFRWAEWYPCHMVLSTAWHVNSPFDATAANHFDPDARAVFYNSVDLAKDSRAEDSDHHFSFRIRRDNGATSSFLVHPRAEHSSQEHKRLRVVRRRWRLSRHSLKTFQSNRS